MRVTEKGAARADARDGSSEGASKEPSKEPGKGTGDGPSKGSRAGRIAGTLFVVILAGASVVAGRALLAERAAAAAATTAAPLETVSVARVAIEDGYVVSRSFIGALEPAQRTGLAFEFAGTVERVFVSEGERVAAGQPVAALDTRLLRAEEGRLAASRRALAAQVELARRTAERQTTLHERGFASSQTLDGAALGLVELEARLAEIDAALAAVEIRLEKSVLRAPFAGHVAERLLDDGASAAPGQAVAALVEAAAPQFRVGLPPDAAEALPADGRVSIELRGRAYPARLVALLPELDPTTRTRPALFRLDGAEAPALRDVGRLSLDQRVETRGAWLPVSAVESGPRGLWRVLTAREGAAAGEGVVGVETVEILHAEAERVFVRGALRDGDRYVADGLHRVTPGQAVRILGSDG